MGTLGVLVIFCVLIISVFGLGNETAVSLPPQPEVHTSNTTSSTTSSTIAPPSPPATTTTTTTTAPPTSNTTTATTTSTTPPTTTTPPTPIPPTPKPTPNPTVANWTVNYGNSNKSCIIIQVALQYVIPESTNRTVKINVPGDAHATGSCDGENNQYLKVTWGQNNSLKFDFGKSNTSKFALDDLSSTLNVTSEKGPKVYKLIHSSPEFSTPLANSYKCAREQTLNLTEVNSNTTVAYLHVSHLQFQAFRNTTEDKFATALDCEGYVTPDIVPIVVGCVLAALIVMVLIAYLVGRRRCQARGYLSMFAEIRTEEDYIPMKNLSCFN